MKVALVQMPVWWTLDPPLGLAQMAGCLRAAGHEVSVFDLNIQLWRRRSPQSHALWSWEQFHFWNYEERVDKFFKENRAALESFLESILKTDARVIGFSVNIGSQIPSLRMAEMIKKADPSRLVVFGGQYFFLGDKTAEMLKNPPVDVVFQGAADESFPLFLTDYARTGRAVLRPGVGLRQGEKIVLGGAVSPVPQLDKVPFADFSLFPMDLYEDQGRIPFAASRGCVWACHYCSTHRFWNGYSCMSGDRMFAEILHHRRLFPQRTHVDFYDITANGRPENLFRFAQLVRDHHQRSTLMTIGWKINAIVRPEMTPELLSALYEAGCMEIIYGIESGSPRVLKRMNKNYSPSVAERVLRDTHAARITTTANFMLGYPGETEEEFGMTLDFLRGNAASLDKAYASATFTSLEENSYLTEHRAEFGIRDPGLKVGHSLYWETEDGLNSYLVRMDRYVRFRALAEQLGLEAYKGINGEVELERLSKLAQYFLYTDNRLRATEMYLQYAQRAADSETARGDLREFQRELEAFPQALRRFERWRNGHSEVPASAQETIWEKANAWLTDDKPFRLEECPQLAEWLRENGRYKDYVDDMLETHAFLQGLKCHAFLRWDKGFRLFWGRDVVEGPGRVAGLLEEVSAALGQDASGGKVKDERMVNSR